MAQGPICIMTPEGLKCLASPLKEHKPAGTDCVEHDRAEEGLYVEKAADVRRKLQKALQKAMKGMRKGSKRHRAATARSKTVQKVVELLMLADVDPDGPFAIVKMR